MCGSILYVNVWLSRWQHCQVYNVKCTTAYRICYVQRKARVYLDDTECHRMLWILLIDTGLSLSREKIYNGMEVALKHLNFHTDT